jgi:hypothetical protein
VYARADEGDILVPTQLSGVRRRDSHGGLDPRAEGFPTLETDARKVITRKFFLHVMSGLLFVRRFMLLRFMHILLVCIYPQVTLVSHL